MFSSCCCCCLVCKSSIQGTSRLLTCASRNTVKSYIHTSIWISLCQEMCGHTEEECGINVDVKNATGFITGLIFHGRSTISPPCATNDDNGRTLLDIHTHTLTPDKRKQKCTKASGKDAKNMNDHKRVSPS
ncbi:hypothetical protein AMECASPLE_005712 [Ameca splendens]|uniref:Uncharacterized protein n=1 Tax=Ameca splendens TaxID=208324 RepID=A0ABV0XC81_9TELE